MSKKTKQIERCIVAKCQKNKQERMAKNKNK